jgi:hypothetical protein
MCATEQNNLKKRGITATKVTNIFCPVRSALTDGAEEIETCAVAKQAPVILML